MAIQLKGTNRLNTALSAIASRTTIAPTLNRIGAYQERQFAKAFAANRTPEGTPWPLHTCLLYTSPSPRDGLLARMPSSA